MAHQQKFSELCASLNYKEQAVWFLNGFWGDGIDNSEANKVYDFFKHFVELDKLGPDKKGEAGNELDQFWSAKFIEDKFSAITALERKAAFKEIDQDNNGKMSMLELLLWHYKKTVDAVATAPQGDNQEAIKAAQAKVDAVMKQMEECKQKLEAQKQAKAENDKAEADLARLEQELKDAVAALEAEEAAYKKKCDDLQAKIDDPSTSGMQKAKANNELAQLKSEDPLPLRRAKITQEAALRKVQKQKKVVAEKGEALQRAINELEAAYDDLGTKMDEAQAELQNVKQRSGGGRGSIWWMERELFEQDAYLPTKRQKYDHSKDFPGI